MSRLHILLSFFSLLLSHFLWAQETIQLKDSITGEAIAHAEVWLFQKGHPAKYFFSDSRGQVPISHSVPMDSMIIRASGYFPLTLKTWQPVIFLMPIQVLVNEQVITDHYHGTFQQKTPYDVSILRAREGESLGLTTVAELLRMEPSLQMEVNPLLGTSLRLLGFGGNHVKILINGVPVIGRVNGEIDLSQLPISSIERIEIVKGPMAAYYGSDAIGGVINLITRKEGKATRIKGFYESTGQYNFDLSYHTVFSKGEAGITVGRYFFDGWDPEGYRRYQLWKPKQIHFAQGSFRHSFLKKATFQWLPSVFYETLWDQGEPIITPYRAYAMDRIYRTLRTVNSASINGYIRPERYLDFQFNHSLFYRTKHTYIKDMTTLHSERSSDPFQNDTTFIQEWNLRGVYSMNYQHTRLNYQVGYDLHLTNGTGDRVNGMRKIHEYALFSSVEYRPTLRWRFRFNLRFPYNTLTQAPLVPSFHIVHEWNEFLTTKFSIGKGFRLPDLKELYLYFVDVNHNLRGNPDLVPEHSWTIQLANRFSKMIANRHAVEFALNPYWSRVENLIQLVLVDGGSNLYSYVNVSEFQSTGFTITASVRSLNWRVVTGFNQNWNQYAGTTMPESRLTFQSAFQFWKHFSISSLFNYTIQGNQLVNNGGTYTFRSIPAHVLWDCTLTYQHRKTKGPSLQLGVKNLLNVQNVTFAGGGGIHTTGNVIAIAPGRRYVSSITWQF